MYTYGFSQKVINYNKENVSMSLDERHRLENIVGIEMKEEDILDVLNETTLISKEDLNAYRNLINMSYSPKQRQETTTVLYLDARKLNGKVGHLLTRYSMRELLLIGCLLKEAISTNENHKPKLDYSINNMIENHNKRIKLL